MHSAQDHPAAPLSTRPALAYRTRVAQFIAVPLIAIMGYAACADGGPTSTKNSPTGASMSIDAASVPAAGGFAVQVLSRASFPDEIDATFRLKSYNATTVVHVKDPSDVVVAKVTIRPGGSFPWHTHPGPAIVSVASGELSIINADCRSASYAAGRAFVDPGQGHVHIGYNAGAVETVAYVTFLDVPAGQPPTSKAEGPAC